MVIMSELEVLNGLCRDLYESVDPGVRIRAEQNLAELADSPECLRRCMILLEQGSLPYGPLVASNTLLKLLNTKTGIVPTQKLELSRYILSMLGTRGPSLPPFLVTSLSQLFVRITKQEWIYTPNDTDFPFREPVDGILKTISMGNDREVLLAIQLMSLLVVDMNSQVGMESVNKHRKTLTHFRDAYLFDVFTSCITLLEEHAFSIQDEHGSELPMILNMLDLTLNCLLFDFIGSLSDETSEDNYNVQVPTKWRCAFTDGKIVSLLFKLYENLPQVATEKVLHILVQLTSIRRTLFNGSERHSYLAQIVGGIKMIIENPGKLSEQSAFHEFCRLIARLKTNYQLCELIKVEQYPAMMRLLAEFTVQSLRMMEFSANSTFFLLNFWQRMVTSVPYVKSSDEHMLNVFCPEIFASFVESRLENVERVVLKGAEDPLEDQGATLQIMELLAVICRSDYEKTFWLLSGHFDENLKALQEAAPDMNSSRYRIAEGRLVWLVTLIGTAVFGKTTVTAVESHDTFDGSLIAKCLTFMRLSDSQLTFPNSTTSDPGNGNTRLEISFVHMLEQFRRAYIMDQPPSQVSRLSPVYESLQTKLGITDESDMLSVIMQKILTNLKFWAMNESILELSLSLLKDLSLGYTAVRKLFRLHEVQLLLNNHTQEHFAFLGPSVDYRTMKHRTTFYEALTRLLTIDLNDDEELFAQFVSPLTDTVKGICNVMNSSNSGVDVDQLRRVVVGVCRDIRGIAIACTTKNLFQILFDWLYPDMLNIMMRSVEEWTTYPEVISPVFRLLAELCQNRQQRLKFEMSSCSAVLLFKETSKIITAFGSRVMMLPAVSKDSIYRQRFKSIGVLFGVLKNALVGAYVPFGVFRLYGDSCLQDSLNMFIKLFMLIPEDDFQSYTKIAQNYYSVLENIAQDNMAFISNLEPDIFAAILRSAHTGVTSLDATVITSACSSLDSLLNYLYKRFTRNLPMTHKVGMEPEGENCLITVKQQPQLLSELLTTMLSALMFADVKCQWSLSRPLLGLILLQEEVFASFKQDIITQQPPERQAPFDLAFTQLMEGVERTLTIKNKDHFTQNLSKFRRDIVEIIKGKDVSPSTSSNEMC